VHHVDTELILAIAASLVVWGLVSARLESVDVSAPMAFVAVGFVLANDPVSVIHVNLQSETLRTLAELTLALLLFSDAARVNLRVLRHDAGVPLRLLLGGLPLTIALGTAIAVVLFPDLEVWVAATIAAAVAPTDAALGAQVVEDPHVPRRIRRILNVESGLNDGIATPFVAFCVAAAVAETIARPTLSIGEAFADLGIGALAGVGVGLGGGLLVRLSARRGWTSSAYRGIGVLALALTAYAGAIELGGNGFIAAFVGGLALGTVLPAVEQDDALAFDAQAGELLSLVVWFLFGAAMISVLDEATWRTVVFAVLALTVVRMAPVALVLAGARLRPMTVAFVGWFGPRGLASVVFGLIAFDALDGPDAEGVLAAVAVTVLLSVVAHGVTARPLSRRYGNRIAALAGTTSERAHVPSLAPRPLTSSRRVRVDALTELDE
jgi:NhaP-type Na+/H+ or K+/H+ antiporter